MKLYLTLGHPKAVTNPETVDFTVRYRLSDPILVEKGLPALRFTLDVLGGSGNVLMYIPGFRIMKGAIKVPSRQQGRYFVEMLEVRPKLMGLLEQMVQVWRDEFPKVQFPEVESE